MCSTVVMPAPGWCVPKPACSHASPVDVQMLLTLTGCLASTAHTLPPSTWTT